MRLSLGVLVAFAALVLLSHYTSAQDKKPDFGNPTTLYTPIAPVWWPGPPPPSATKHDSNFPTVPGPGVTHGTRGSDGRIVEGASQVNEPAQEHQQEQPQEQPHEQPQEQQSQ